VPSPDAIAPDGLATSGAPPLYSSPLGDLALEDTTMKAVLNGNVIAESDETIVVEGNHYFPPASLDRRLLEPSRMRTLCF